MNKERHTIYTKQFTDINHNFNNKQYTRVYSGDKVHVPYYISDNYNYDYNNYV